MKKILTFGDIVIVLIRENKEVPNNIFTFNSIGKEIWQTNDIVKAKIPRGFDDIKK
ncbi:hypothetical protein [Streptococcus intermedius]|uniref:hypothetical protein n=1 Tax=Streptococcus intermedius TaxID=1338 RepID=UPI000B189755|nr:hypothetical protein [Streptococcus intermedius]